MPTFLQWQFPAGRKVSTASIISPRQAPFNRNRLPTLYEVLNELTLEPVDLASFLQFMRKQQRSSDYLDFILSVCDHAAFCRVSLSARKISRLEIKASAEKILYTFVLRGAEREINLPPNLITRMTKLIEQSHYDPAIFEASKMYIFNAIELCQFPQFLKCNGLGNLGPTSRMARIFVGLLAMFAGSWLGFIFILLDTPAKDRCPVILPFFVGAYCLCSYQYNLDPFLALIGLSEQSFAKYMPINERFVSQLMKKRALIVLLSILLSGCSFIALFLSLPGKQI